MKTILLFFLLIPLAAFSNIEGDNKAKLAIEQNNNFVDQLAQIAPMSINPYTSVFVTSVCSKIGFNNKYVSTHPFYNNWVVLIVSGFLFFFTLIVRPTMATNQLTGVLVKADNWLESKAGLIINAVVVLLPTFFSTSAIDNEVVVQAGFLSISFKTLLLLITSTYVLLVIMTVSLFIDFLLFLSPIPFVDTALQIAKIVISTILVVISIISPITSLIITLVMFMISLFFINQAKKLNNKVEYLIVYPILNAFRSKEKVLTNGTDFSIVALTKTKTSKFRKNRIVRLEQKEGKFYLTKNRFLLPKQTEELHLASPTLTQSHLDIILTCNAAIELTLNRSYHSYIDELSEKLDAKTLQRAEIKLNLDEGIFKRIKSMFNQEDLQDLNTI